MIVSRAEKEENPLPVAGIGGLEHTLLDDDGEDEAPAYGAPPNVMASWITKVSSADRLPIGTFNVDVSAAMLPPGAQKTSSSSSSGMGGGHGGAAPTAAGRQRRLPELPGVGPATHTSSSSSPLARSTLPSLHSSPMLIKKWMQIVRNTMMMHVANDGKVSVRECGEGGGGEREYEGGLGTASVEGPQSLNAHPQTPHPKP